MTTDYTDQVYQEVKVFIEGIQVPYLSISIRQGYEALPTASLEIPALIGMETIDKFYNPKVHIFTIDPVTYEEIVLFHGLITGHQYNKQTSGQGSKSMIYHCEHPYHLLSQITLYYSGVLSTNDLITSQKDAVDRSFVGSLYLFMLESLTGISKTGQQSTGGPSLSGTNEARKPTSKNWDELPESLHDSTYESRLSGIPGVFLKMWNILKTNHSNKNNVMMDHMYIPLVEGGLSSIAQGTGIDFFKRMSGVSFIEDSLYVTDVSVSKSSKKNTDSKYTVLVPPIFHSFSHSVMTSLIPNAMKYLAISSNEYTNFWEIINNFIHFIDYDYNCLASPSQTDTGHQAIDFVVKPQTAFYYSPICNVIFPNMYDSLQIQDETGGTPTRLLGKLNKNIFQKGEGITETYRSPESVREAVMKEEGGNDLESTLDKISNAVGPFEFGRGVDPKSINLPDWIFLLAGTETKKVSESDDLVFSTLDVEYYKRLAGSRTGQISSAFNPYVVPGFPIDVLDDDYLAPSYHGLCTSITHSITPQSIKTQIGFTSILSYDELGSYKVPPTYPWLDEALNIDSSGQWVDLPSDSKTKTTADEFYEGLFNVPAVDPGDIYDFKTHQVKPIQRTEKHSGYTLGSKESHKDENGLETNPWLSYVGNLSTAYRPIETLPLVEKFKKLTFIPFEDQNTGNQEVPFIDMAGYKNQKEFGQNLFLDYNYEN